LGLRRGRAERGSGLVRASAAPGHSVAVPARGYADKRAAGGHEARPAHSPGAPPIRPVHVVPRFDYNARHSCPGRLRWTQPRLSRRRRAGSRAWIDGRTLAEPRNRPASGAIESWGAYSTGPARRAGPPRRTEGAAPPRRVRRPSFLRTARRRPPPTWTGRPLSRESR
jgi:hypothetical protein